MRGIRPSLRYTVRWHVSLAGVLALLAVLCTMVGMAAFLPPAPVLAQATAQEVPRLQAQVTDLTNAQVLANGRAQIEAALTELREIPQRPALRPVRGVDRQPLRHRVR